MLDRDAGEPEAQAGEDAERDTWHEGMAEKQFLRFRIVGIDKRGPPGGRRQQPFGSGERVRAIAVIAGMATSRMSFQKPLRSAGIG